MLLIKILAVEDEPIYAELLEMVIHELNYELVQVVDNAADAMSWVKKSEPDLILMDIEINDSINGIELAARLKNITDAAIIYVTSHKDKETFQQAKLTTPDAFIIKPYDKESLQAAIELALIRSDINRPVLSEQVNKGESFYIKDNGSLYKINPLEILFVEADEKYCTIHTKQKKHTINIRLKEIFERLSPADFMQTHRSYIVRKDAIEKINIAEQTLTVAGINIPVGRSFKDGLLSKLNYL